MVNHPGKESASMLCTLHSDDANSQAANLINWQQEYDQLSGGRFLGVINEVNFPHVHVFREDTSHGLRQQCRIEEGGLWLGFSANNKTCRINNEPSDNSLFLCRSGNQDFELLTPDEFSIFGLVLHPSLFTQLSEQDNATLFRPDCNELWLNNVSSHTLLAFRQYLSLLLHPAGNRWSSDTQASILQDAILDLLCQAKPAAASNEAAPQRQRIMRRVNDYLSESRLKTPLTISEICTAVHVSRRTLQYTFNECCGMSPKQYIRITRLNQVRRVLLSQGNDRCIADIAFDFGFFHPGQFGQDYKRLFGETPLQTRNRLK
jgi:AraC family ethanolamine operon transcriptional activator